MNKRLTAMIYAAKVSGSSGNNGTSISNMTSRATANRTMDTLVLSRHRYNSCVPGCFGVPRRVDNGNVAMAFSSFILVQPYTCKRSTIVCNLSNTVLTLKSSSSSSLSIPLLSRSLNILHQFSIGTISRNFTSTSDFDGTSNIVKNEFVPEFTLDEQELLEKIEFKGGSFIDIGDFEKLMEKELCKKIDVTFCQDNRDYEHSSKNIKQGKEILLNQTLDTELENKKQREPVYYAGKNGAILAESVRTRQRKNDIKGEEIGRLPSGTILERAVRVLKESDNACGYYYVGLNGSNEYVGIILLATYIGNRPPGKTVDHINRRKDDNRIQNLRWATKKERNENQIYQNHPFPFEIKEHSV